MTNKIGIYSSGRRVQSNTARQTSLAVTIVCVVIAGLISAALLCKPAPTSTEALTAVDVSYSNGRRLDSESGLLEYAVDEELPSNTSLTVWAFSNYREARKVYSAVPGNGMSLWGVEKSLAELVTERDMGTYPQTAVKAIADSADVSTAGQIVCVLLWDGENAGDMKSFSEQAKRLADNPKVAAVVCIGIIPDKGIRSQVEKAMQCLGDRLIVCGPHDRSQINRLSDLLKKHVEAIRARY